MTSIAPSDPVTARTAIATGIAMIVSLVLLVVFYTLGQPFGTLNDLLNGVVGILSGLLARSLFSGHASRSPLLAQLARLAAWTGAILVVVGSVLVVTGITGWVLAGLYTAAGYGLIGVWLAIFSNSMRLQSSLPKGLSRLGLATGALMGLGLFVVPGILAGIDSLDTVPWYLKVAVVSGLGSVVMYPGWCFWLGRILLNR